MSDSNPTAPFSGETHVLIPVELPDPAPISPWLGAFLGSAQIHVLGYFEIPEQTSPEQARDQFEDESRRALDDIAGDVRSVDSDVETSLVFTGDVLQTIERVGTDLEIDAIVEPRPVSEIRSVLAIFTRHIDYDRFVETISTLCGDGLERLVLLQVTDTGEETDEQELILDGLQSRLAEADLDDELIETESLTSPDPAGEVAAFAETFDLAIVAEREPTLTDRLAGTVAEHVFDATDLPVVFVRLPE